MKNEEIIWNYLYSKLNNAYGTAAMMGNLFAESSLNPILANGIKKYGMTSQEYTAIVDSGKNNNFITDGIAYGLVQWRYHTRKKGLLDKARSTGKSVGDINLQLDYMWDELQSYKTVIKALYSATNIKEPSDLVMLKYERPGNTSESSRQKRARYAQDFYDKFSTKQDVRLNINKSALVELQRAIERNL